MKFTGEMLAQELIRRSNIKPPLKLIRSPDFHAQNEAIDDNSKLKAYNCPRRAGKSIAVAVEFTESAQAIPKTNYLYIALTIASAREILWDALKDLNEKCNTGAIANETRLELLFPNGSKIKFAGADCSEKQMRKVLGQKYKKVAIDEAGSFTINMTRLVYQMIRPTLIDQRGQLILLGTCENIPLTFFEQVTEGKEPGWSVHKWTALDNPYMKDQWEEEIADLKKNNPNVIYTSWFKTHYLNQWCSDDDLLIVPIKPEYLISAIPDRKGYEYVLGVDLGFNDASAFSLLAYHVYDNKAYVVESYKKEGLTLTKVAGIIKSYQSRYPIADMVIDGANKQGVEDIKERFKIKLESAQKTEKAFFLKAMNDDLIEGNLKIVEKDNIDLIGGRKDGEDVVGEWRCLQWKDSFKKEEDPRCQNHCSDATLYGWRKCCHYLVENEPKKIKKGTLEHQEYLEEQEIIRLEREFKEQQEEREFYAEIDS